MNKFMMILMLAPACSAVGAITTQQPAAGSYPIVDTAQTNFYDASSETSAPAKGASFYGQDGHYVGQQPDYTISSDGLTVVDNVTGLIWTRSHDWDSDGDLDDADDKKTQADAEAYADTLNAQGYGGYSDWRLPSTKELYSLMNVNGTDPNPMASDSSSLTPFIDDSVFMIGYGDTAAGDRIIDSQFATTTIYVDTVMNNQSAMFGLNLADGRIKGYPQYGKTYYALYCRGNTSYGTNEFADNGDGTVTDHATGLMWAQDDSGSGTDWEAALAYAETNELAGHTDWRLPNAKELQSLVDYTRSPGTTGSAAIDPLFSATQITNMAGEADYPWYWSGTTHLKYTGSAASGVYVCFGRGLGTMDEGVTIIDVHGAGCQRSDPKTGDPASYPSSGHGPQGDVQRVYNYVRLVRDADADISPVTAAQTNVLLIIADDLGLESLAGFNDDPGASLPPTPTIDSLQTNGVSFTRFYSYSTCSPSRGSMITGRYSFRTGIVSPDMGEYTLQSNEFTLPEALIESGVISNRMAHFGKWHLGSRDRSPNMVGGWPHFSGSLGGGVLDYYSWSKTVNGVTTTNYTVYATTDQVNDAAAWIDQQGTNSWFAWVAFNAPHTPMQRPPNDLHDYDGITDDGANASRDHFEAMVQAMDTEIARLLTHVDLSNTTVIFMGDNGTTSFVVQPPISTDHCKGSIYDGGIRVPLVIAGAAVSNGLEGTETDCVLHSVDLYSTILELFGVNTADVFPQELVLDSLSFVPLLQGHSYERGESIASFNVLGGVDERSVIDGDYKYIDLGGGTQEFYNVAIDFPETNNLLDGVLSGEEMVVYQSLTNKMATYINTPQCYSAAMDSNGKFNVEVGWFDNDSFTLWHTGDLVSGEWAIVSGQELVDNGNAVLTLSDPNPPASNAFYRVTTP